MEYIKQIIEDIEDRETINNKKEISSDPNLMSISEYLKDILNELPECEQVNSDMFKKLHRESIIKLVEAYSNLYSVQKYWAYNRNNPCGKLCLYIDKRFVHGEEF